MFIPTDAATACFCAPAFPRAAAGIEMPEPAFRLPMAVLGEVGDHTLTVCNTFNTALRRLCGTSLYDLDLQNPSTVPLLQDALHATLTQHSFPNAPYNPIDVIKTLEKGGLRLPKDIMAPVMREFGVDLKPESPKFTPAPDVTCFAGVILCPKEDNKDKKTGAPQCAMSIMDPRIANLLRLGMPRP